MEEEKEERELALAIQRSLRDLDVSDPLQSPPAPLPAPRAAHSSLRISAAARDLRGAAQTWKGH